ncbi:MAG: hypothetical protein K0S49_397 [Microbacterium sp.]|jgi:uncharacterized membrane-anchored protein|nr:hypothetical protein [Microbacterium sp.]
MAPHDGRGVDSNMARVGGTFRVMQMDGREGSHSAWRLLSLAGLWVGWFLVIWWTGDILPTWIRLVLATVWVLSVVGGLGMALEWQVARRRGRNKVGSS